MKIAINQLELTPIIGAFEWERQAPMTIYADIVLECDIPDGDDDLAETVDYYTLSQMLIAEAKQTNFKLLEKLAYFLQHKIIAFDERIKAMTLVVSKKGILQQAQSTSVSLSWSAQ